MCKNMTFSMYLPVAKCDYLAPLGNGSINYNNGRRVNDTAVYVCNEGFEIIPEGNNKTTCIYDEGYGYSNWTGPPPICRSKYYTWHFVTIPAFPNFNKCIIHVLCRQKLIMVTK